MVCECDLHFIKNITVTATEVTLNPDDGNNLSDLDNFNFVICNNFNGQITGAPVPVVITLNGTAIPVQNRFGIPILSNHLSVRKKYIGTYINGTNGIYLILGNTPCKKRFAR